MKKPFHPGAIHNQSVFKRDALGVISYLSDRPLDYPDVVKVASIRPYKSEDGRGPTFGFTVSHRRGEQLRKMLAAGQKLVVEAKVKASLYDSKYENVKEDHTVYPRTRSSRLYAARESENR
jgi:hypothetical protein